MGIFNIEGGCYAKCEGLDAFREPEIFNAVRFGAICENVVLDENRKPNYDDISITHNTRVAYPVEHIPNAWTKGMGTTPSVVLFLTCDAFGVLPPISRLTADAAMYHFVTGFTAKIPGTEVGVTEPTRQAENSYAVFCLKKKKKKKKKKKTEQKKKKKKKKTNKTTSENNDKI